MKKKATLVAFSYLLQETEFTKEALSYYRVRTITGYLEFHRLILDRHYD